VPDGGADAQPNASAADAGTDAGATDANAHTESDAGVLHHRSVFGADIPRGVRRAHGGVQRRLLHR
jgi:hypothetical protein